MNFGGENGQIWGIVFMVLGIVAILFFIVRIFFWRRIREKFAPNPERYISAMRFCEDRNVRDTELKLTRYCAEIPKERKGWFMVHKVLVPDIKEHRNYLIITERDNVPLDLFESLSEPEKNVYHKSKFDQQGWATKPYTGTTKVCDDCSYDIQLTAAADERNKYLATVTSIIAMGLACVFGIMAIIAFWQGGGGA